MIKIFFLKKINNICQNKAEQKKNKFEEGKKSFQKLRSFTFIILVYVLNFILIV